MAWADPKNMSGPFFNSLVVSSVSGVGEGDTWIIVESLKNQYPTRLRVYLEINYLNTSPCLASQIQSTNGVFTISHISGSAPFSCPIPWEGGFRGRSHLSPT